VFANLFFKEDGELSVSTLTNADVVLIGAVDAGK
jgi:hypothetical protein